MQIGIYEKAINNKFSWEDKMLIAKKAGYDFIEFSIDESDFRLKRLDWSNDKINEIKQLLIKHDFYFNSMALSGLRKFPLGSKDKNIQENSIQITKKAINLAKKLGIRYIQLAGYDVYYDKGDEKTKEIFIKNTEKILEYALEKSVVVSFEIMDTPFMGTITKYLDITKDIQSPMLSLYPDLGNLWRWAPQNIEDEINKGIHKIIAFHLKDTLPNNFRDVDFGKGDVDFHRIFQHLKKINYHGPFLVEMWSSNTTKETCAQNVAKIQSAKKFIEEVKENVWKIKEASSRS